MFRGLLAAAAFDFFVVFLAATFLIGSSTAAPSTSSVYFLALVALTFLGASLVASTVSASA